MIPMSQFSKTALEHWRDLKFGMFIHFGVYSMLAGEWKGETVKGHGEWLQCAKKIPNQDYIDATKNFNPVDWNPEEIAMLAKLAGMKYLVITAKHHDGFALFDSKASSFNVMNTPYGKDLLRPLVEACRRHDILPCFYYSQDLDWNDPHGGGNTWDFDPAQKDFSYYLEHKVKPQLTELLTEYGEIGLIWFDVPITVTKENSQEIADHVHALQPSCLVNGRIGHGCGDFQNLGDNQVPGGRCEGFAETAGTLNDNWGYTNADQNWKSPRDLIVQLCDLASKGVNYLLNIGPTGTGRILPETKKSLLSMGEWLRRCGEAIYGTEPNPYPVSFPWGSITMKDHRIFFLITKIGAESLELDGVLDPPQSVAVLGHPEVQPKMTWKKGVLRLQWAILDEGFVPVIEVTFYQKPRLDSTLRQWSNGQIILPAYLSKIQVFNDKVQDMQTLDDLPEDVRVQYASKVRLWGDKRPRPWTMHHDAGGYIENWRSTDNHIEWTFGLSQPGEYEVWVSSVSSKYVPWVGGHIVSVKAGESECEGPLVKELAVQSPRSRYFPENICKIGHITLGSTGLAQLSLRAKWINKELREGLAVTEVKLIPVKKS